MKLNIIAKYGTLITSAILILIGVMTWFIKYPETVSTQSKLTGTNAPKPIIPKQNLRLIHLFKTNNQEVQIGEVIGILETTADYNEILEFENLLNEIEQNIGKDGQLTSLRASPLSVSNKTDTQLRVSTKALMQKTFHQLGELQSDYQALIQAYIPYRDYVLGDYASKKKSLLHKDLSIAHQSRNVLNEQKHLQEKDLGLSQTTIDKNKKLLDEKLISEQEYRELTSQYIVKQMSEPQIKSSYINNESQINNINKELVEIDNQILTQKSLFSQAILQTKSKIEAWKQLYLLTATASGKLVFTSFLQENQNLDAGKVIAHIVPAKSDIYLETLVPQSNFGKVTTEQKVILKFDAYPWQEFGAVVGKIEYISPVPVDSGYYLAKVILPENLKTNYKKEIPFIEGLVAQSEIVTKDLRLAESLYYDLVKTIKK